MLEILKQYGIYYVEVDLSTGERKEWIHGTYADVLAAFAEIIAKGVLKIYGMKRDWIICGIVFIAAVLLTYNHNADILAAWVKSILK